MHKFGKFFEDKIEYLFLNFPSLRKYIKSFIYSLVEFLISSNKIVANVYTNLFGVWGASWFDHRFDYLRGYKNYYWMERGFFSLEKIKHDSSILDIGFGDGLLDSVFYSTKAKIVEAIDIDASAVKFAKKKYSLKNLKYYKSDALTWLSRTRKYDTILMFAVLEHFTPSEGQDILKMIKKSLNANGIFYGSTPVFKSKGGHNFEHKNEFTSVEQLRNFLIKVFSKVNIYTSNWPNGRLECYFECRS